LTLRKELAVLVAVDIGNAEGNVNACWISEIIWRQKNEIHANGKPTIP